MTVLFTRVHVFDPATPSGMSGPTDVLVAGQRIISVGVLDDRDAVRGQVERVIDGHERMLLVPGLVNAHFHSPANHLKGSIGSLPLELFMLYESPADAALTPTPREAYLRTMLAAIEMLRSGTTSVQDDAFVMPAPTPEIVDAIMQAYADCGIRATVALDQPELPDSAKHSFLSEIASPALAAELSRPMPASADELLDVYRWFVGTWHGAAADRLRTAVSVSAPQRVSPEYFGALDEISREHGLPVFAHMLETRPQRTLATGQPRFAGRSLVEYTHDLGLLSERMNVIHAVWTDEHDLDLIAASGATIAHNPISNLRLGSGVMPFRAARDRGIPVALGSDEAICDDAVNMWAVAKATGLIHNVSGLDSDLWPRAEEVLDALWRGGAQAQGRAGELGTVTPGALADLALIDLHTLAFTPLNDLRQQLVYCEDGRDVELVMVDGVVVAEHGHVTSVDEAALLDEARDVFAAQRPRREMAARRADTWFPEYQTMVRRAAATDVGFTRWVGSR